jgi:hypothetical protein
MSDARPTNGSQTTLHSFAMAMPAAAKVGAIARVSVMKYSSSALGKAE